MTKATEHNQWYYLESWI